MLFKMRFHPGLRDGSIDLTFRRWTTPKVKVGGSYRLVPGPGALVVGSIEKVPFGAITTREARRAGFATLDELRAALRVGGKSVTARTPVYRVRFRYDATGGTSPAPPGDVGELVARLRRMDRLSRRGPWTKQVLALIGRHPQRRAGDLAPRLDRELPKFKADVRKLKRMGLTTSFEVGYELTALGTQVLKAL